MKIISRVLSTLLLLVMTTIQKTYYKKTVFYFEEGFVYFNLKDFSEKRSDNKFD